MENMSTRALELLAPLYDAAFGQPADWAVFMDRLRLTMEGDVGVLALIGIREPSAEFIAQSGISEEMQRQYAERFVALDPWPAAFRDSGLSLGRNGCSQDFVSMRDFARSEYYNEFWRPNDDLFHTCGGFFAVDDAHVGMLATPRSRRRSAFSREHAALMDLVSPHVGRALQLRQRLAHAETAKRNLEAALDASGDALLVLDATGRILSANHAADAALASARCVTSRGGILTATSTRDDAKLQNAIRITAAATRGSSLSCPAPVAMHARQAAFTITCFPLSMRHIEDMRGLSTARVLVSMTAVDTAAPGVAHLLRLLFDLTPTEALLAEGLANGDDLDEVARRLRMTKGTARIHLRHVFLKTDTRRQAQLVALIHRAVPMPLLRG